MKLAPSLSILSLHLLALAALSYAAPQAATDTTTSTDATGSAPVVGSGNTEGTFGPADPSATTTTDIPSESGDGSGVPGPLDSGASSDGTTTTTTTDDSGATAIETTASTTSPPASSPTSTNPTQSQDGNAPGNSQTPGAAMRGAMPLSSGGAFGLVAGLTLSALGAMSVVV